MKKTRFLFALFIVLSFACTGIDNPFEPGNDYDVAIRNSLFVPATLTVTLSARIFWTNNDQKSHTVDSGSPGNPNLLFNRTLAAQGETTSEAVTFQKTGVYPYYCGLHGETGSITVN